MEDEINKEYVGDKPHSFGGKYRLYDVYEDGRVDKALHKSDVYSKFKQHRRSKSYSPIYSLFISSSIITRKNRV